MSSNDLLERYVYAVASNLPKGERQDVARELRSLIEDMVEERAGVASPAAEEGALVEVLRDLGQPALVAERYGQPRPYLVGPTYYPIFKTVTSIVTLVLTVLFVGATVLSLVFGQQPPEAQLEALGKSLLQFGTSLLTNVGIIVLVFAVIERVAGPQASEEADWDPRKLPSINDPARLDRADTAFELGFDLLGLAVFNYLVQRGTPVILLDSPQVTTFWVKFTPAFLAWAPWIVATFVVSIALNLFLLWRGYWETMSRLASLAIGLFTSYVLLRVLLVEPITTANWMDIVVKMVLGVVLVIVLVDMAQQLYRLIQRARKEDLNTSLHAGVVT